MIANHIHDALAQVKTLQAFIIERNMFKGYSGKARLVAGVSALCGTVVMERDIVPRDPLVHLAVWGLVLVVSVAANYGALVYWFLFNPSARRNPLMLKPAVDALPALAVGAALSLALVLRSRYDLLPGVWVALYGLAQVAYRQSLPVGIYQVGIFYVCAGAYLLLSPAISFTHPWPVGCVFFAGEIAGGIVLITAHRQDRRAAAEESPT